MKIFLIIFIRQTNLNSYTESLRIRVYKSVNSIKYAPRFATFNE